TSSLATLYCLPPVRITANMMLGYVVAARPVSRRGPYYSAGGRPSMAALSGNGGAISGSGRWRAA
ncbi:MAG: hypothetical protein ACREFH_09575, partial [Stellaceae bacterium]